MNEREEENLCKSIYNTLENAKSRLKQLEGRDKLALQMELLEWMSGEWKEMEVEYMQMDDY